MMLRESFKHRLTYNPTPSGFLSYLQPSWILYAELMRLDRPGGLFALYTNCLYGIAYVAAIAPTAVTKSLMLSRAATLLLSCILARGAACTWNDRVDKDLDILVSRCQDRPIARGAVSPKQANIFAVVQVVPAVLTCLMLPVKCVPYIGLAVVLSTVYPFSKRVTNYPQLVLGCTFGMAVLIATQSMNVDPLSLPMLCFFVANMLWIVIYDTIYAHQDVVDDMNAGVGSMAVRFRILAKFLFTCLAVAMTAFLTGAGIFAGWGPTYFALACGGSLIGLITMIVAVDLESPDSCAWWFNWNFLLVGGSIITGLMGEYVQVDSY